MKQTEFEEKLSRIVRLLGEEKLGGVLINAQHNFAWLTGGGTNGMDQSREAGAATLFVRADGRQFILANRIEMPRLLSEELSEADYEPVEFAWEAERADPAFVAKQAAALLKDDTISSALGSDLPLGGPTVRTIEGSLARARYQLTEPELQRLRELGRDAGAAIGEVARTLEPGLTEVEIARRASDALHARGCRAVVTLIAADERLRRFRHPVPTTRRWEQVVMIVVGAKRQGLIVSLTRIVTRGSVPDDLRQRTHATAKANAALFHHTRPGTSGRELYNAVASAYREQGFPGEEHLHHQGGACGYRSRDWVAHPESEERVQPHQAFAWNPSITGTKTEETCIAFAGDIEVVTASPGWPMIPVYIEGHEYLLPDVLSI